MTTSTAAAVRPSGGRPVEPSHTDQEHTMTNLYRRRPAEIEAIQWADTNAAALEAFAGQRFMTVDPEDRIDDAEATASLRKSEHECWSLLRPGDWVVKRGDDFAVLTPGEFADLYEPAAVSSPLPDQTAGHVCKFDEGCHRVVPCQPGCGAGALPDRAALRDRIAAALRVHYHCIGDLDPEGPIPCSCGWMDPGPEATHQTDFDAHMADVVLAELPPSADRATVLLEARDVARAEAERLEMSNHDARAARGARSVAYLLRRLAAEAQQSTGTVFSPGEGVHGQDPYYGGAEAQQPEPASTVERVARRLAGDWMTDDDWSAYPEKFREDYRAYASEVIALAHGAEAQQPDTETGPEQLYPARNTWTFEVCYDPDENKWHGCGSAYDSSVFDNAHETAKDDFQHRAETDRQRRKFRMVRATTTYTVEAEHQAPAVLNTCPAKHPTMGRICELPVGHRGMHTGDGPHGGAVWEGDAS